MLSPDLQRVAIEDYAATTGRVVTHWLEGLDESGSQSRSRWWARLDEACSMVEARTVDVVLVWKFSRTARNRLKWAVALDRVEACGGALESATERLDTTTSTGRFARGMLAELNAFEAERIGEQWKETHAHRLARGLPHTGHPRFGYAYTPGQGYAPDPETAPLVRDLYSRYLAGDGLRALSTWLTTLGVRSPKTGKVYTWRGVGYYLDSGFAAGLLAVHDPECRCQRPANCARKEHRPGDHAPIITTSTWEQYRATRRRRAFTTPRHHAPTTPLAGLVICVACEHRMRCKWGSKQPAYLYVCEHPACPGRVSVTRSRCETAVLDWLRDVADDVDARADLAASQVASRAAARTERAHYARQAAALDKAMTGLTLDRARRIVPEAAFIAAMDELIAEQATVREALDRLGDLATPRPSRAAAVRVIDGWDNLPVADRRRMLEPLLRVLVSRPPGGRPEVRVVPAWER